MDTIQGYRFAFIKVFSSNVVSYTSDNFFPNIYCFPTLIGPLVYIIWIFHDLPNLFLCQMVVLVFYVVIVVFFVQYYFFFVSRRIIRIEGNSRDYQPLEHAQNNLPVSARIIADNQIVATVFLDYDAVADQLYAGSPVQPLRKWARRDKIEKLTACDLIDYDGPTRDRLYWVIDEGVEPKVELLTATCINK
ncbi:AAA family ATPase [Natrinema mahii]|nr:AAA family ATPase [Natrinema mahii]